MLDRKQCWICNTPLDPEPCLKCQGIGVRFFFGFKRTCRECGGAGVVYRQGKCPNMDSHSKILSERYKNQLPPSTSPGQVCPNCGGSGKDPVYGQLGIPCPRCNGSGYLFN